MTETTVRDRLRAFNPLELAAKAAFSAPRGRDADPVTLLREILRPALPLGPDGLPAEPKPGDWIPESAFLRGDADVAVVKHIRYLPVVPHAHEFIELTYVYEGACEHAVHGGAPSPLEQGDLVIVPPGLRHAVSVFDDATIVVNILVRRSTFDRAFFELLTGDDILAELFTRLIYGPAEPHPCIRFRTGDDAHVRAIVEELYREAEDDRRYRTRALNLFVMQLCTALMSDHEQDLVVLGAPADRQGERIYEALRYVEANFREVTLRDLAGRFGYSESHLSRLISRLTGRTFSGIVRELRDRRAAELLTNPAVPLEHIVEEAGYTDASHFYRSFRRANGMTPAEYRRRAADDRKP